MRSESSDPSWKPNLEGWKGNFIVESHYIRVSKGSELEKKSPNTTADKIFDALISVVFHMK